MNVDYRYMLDNLADVTHLLTVHNETMYCAGLSRAKTVVERGNLGQAFRTKYATAVERLCCINGRSG